MPEADIYRSTARFQVAIAGAGVHAFFQARPDVLRDAQVNIEVRMRSPLPHELALAERPLPGAASRHVMASLGSLARAGEEGLSLPDASERPPGRSLPNDAAAPGLGPVEVSECLCFLTGHGGECSRLLRSGQNTGFAFAGVGLAVSRGTCSPRRCRRRLPPPPLLRCPPSHGGRRRMAAPRS